MIMLKLNMIARIEDYENAMNAKTDNDNARILECENASKL